MIDPAPGENTNSAFVPYFDREAMLRLSAEDNGQRAYRLLAASKSQAGACLDGIPSLDGMPRETVVRITLQLLEKGWLVRIISWLTRIMNEIPSALCDNVIAIMWHDYWNRDADADEKFGRSRELFSQRFESFFNDFLERMEARGKWDPKIDRAYGMYLRHVAKRDVPAAKSFRAAFQFDGDAAAIVPYAQILFEKHKIEPAKRVLAMGWEQYRDVESLRALAQVHFMTKNSEEAIPLYQYLQDIGEPLEGDLWTHLRDFRFPRDFDALEKLGESGADRYLGPDFRKDLLEAIDKGFETQTEGTPEAMWYQLRGLRLAALEFRNYSASQQFVTYVMALYEGGWERRALLKDFLENNPLPRVRTFLKNESDDETGGETVESENIDGFEPTLSAHLYLASRFALAPDRADLIKVLKNFSEENDLPTLKPLMHDLTLVHIRIKAILKILGDDFSDCYVRMQESAMEFIKTVENYDAVMIAVLEGTCSLDSPVFEDYGSLVAFTMAAILYGADVDYTEKMIGMINLDFMSPLAAKQFARLLQGCGYERYALSAFAVGDLYDIEVVSSMLNLAFSGNHAPEDLVVALRTRPDFDPENPIDLKVIVAELLRRNVLPDGSYPAEILAMFGETAIAYGEIRSGLSILRDAAAAGNLRAKTRIAEYYLYSVPRPKKALRLFEEIHEITEDPRFLADIARANQLIMESEAQKHPDENAYDASKLLKLIEDLPEDHPDYFRTFLELSVAGDDEIFHRACRMLLFSDPLQIESLSEELLLQYDIRMYQEIERIESLQRVEWADIAKHLFYSRTFARVHCEEIEFTLDYLGDLLKYLDGFQIVDSESVDKKPKESLENRRKSLRNDVFVHFFKQFADVDFSEESDEMIYSLMEYDPDGREIGMFDQIVDPLVIALIFEIGYFERLHMGDRKMPKFYEFVAEIFESVCQHRILAEQYEQKGRKIAEYLKKAKKPKSEDESTWNSPTLLH